MSSTRRALFFSFLDRYSGLVVGIVSSMIIARLLTPQEIGVFSVAIVLLAFIQALRDLGAGQYLLQERELTTDRIRATWSVQLGSGLLFALIALAAARPAASFYAEPRIRDIMLVVAANFALAPFGSLTYAWLTREVRFESLAIMRLSGSSAGALISIALAWQGWGAISLAWGSLAGTIMTAIVGVRYRPKHFPWGPGLREVRRVFSFGTKVSGVSLLNVAGNGAAEMVLGKAQGMADVGIFSRSNGLVSMFHRLFVDATYTVALAQFAKHYRAQRPVVEPLRRFTSAVLMVGLAFFAVLAVNAKDIILVLYGYQWGASVLPTQILCLAGALLLPHTLFGAALLATGNAGALLRGSTIDTLQRVTWFTIGAILGLEELAVASVVASVLGFGIWFAILNRALDLRLAAVFEDFHKPLIVALVVGLSACLPHWTASYWSPASTVTFIASLVSACGAFLAMLYLTRHFLATEINRVISGLSIRLIKRSSC